MAGSIFIPDVIEESLNGIFASNATRATLPVVVAPTQSTRAADNLVRQELIVVACASLAQFNFDFDSSFVRPEAKPGFASFARLRAKHDASPMSIFGHADPSGRGSDAQRLHYNHALSERRARAVFGVLVRDPAVWEKLFTAQEGAIGDVWGARVLGIMATALGETTPVVNTPVGRSLLIGRYMDFLRGAPSQTPPFPTLTTNDFLGRGKQKATLQGCSSFNPQLLMSKKQLATFDEAADKAPRDLANEPNRRVMIFLFQKGTEINPALWPCPALAEGEAACNQRQWSNGKDRRSTLFVDHRRRFGREVPPDGRLLSPPNQALADALGQEETTFGCRFYHGVALHSPCERDVRMWGIQILVDGAPPINPVADAPPLGKQPLAKRRFAATIGTAPDAPVVRGTTTDNGTLVLPLFDPKVTITLRIDAFDALVPPRPPAPPGANPPAPPPPPAASTTDSTRFDDEDQFLTLTLAAGSLEPIRARDAQSAFFDPDFDLPLAPPTADTRERAAMQRLFNLGFGKDDTGGPQFSGWSVADRQTFLRAFQRANKLTESGVVDTPTADALFTSHGS